MPDPFAAENWDALTAALREQYAESDRRERHRRSIARARKILEPKPPAEVRTMAPRATPLILSQREERLRQQRRLRLHQIKQKYLPEFVTRRFPDHVAAAGDKTDGMIFILSDATPDRFGDIVEPSGWVLDSFRRNPVALFNHNKDFIVGSWADVHIGDGALKGRRRLLPRGAARRVDEIRTLVEAGVLRATSSARSNQRQSATVLANVIRKASCLK